MPDIDPIEELECALQSDQALTRWLATRGFVPHPDPLPLPDKKSVAGAVHFHAPAHARAPYLLYLWHQDMRERSIHGNQLRNLQRDANQYRDRLRAGGHKAGVPHLCVVGCPDFFMVFPLSGDPFARRLRFSPDRLRHPSSPLYDHFQNFRAASMETWVRDAGAGAGDDLFAELLSDDELDFDFSRLFVGGQLDDEFVAFMDLQRRRIAAHVLDRKLHGALLEPMWKKLRIRHDAERTSEAAPLPDLAELIGQRRMRNSLIAAVDTVLLRLVLYRYLEAQFDHAISDDEQRQIALGASYDQLLEQTARVDHKKLRTVLDQARKTFRARKPGGQLDLFAQPPVEMVEPERFSAGMRERAEHYQASAGGDLHQGNVAEAADVLQAFLHEHRPGDCALLLAGTSTEQYSFHYADLDARAFQRFYEQTIGTDIRISYDPQSRSARVGVVDHQRNRKEQGAYFTDERICTWLVQRTLGRRFDVWLNELGTLLASKKSGSSAGREPAVRAKLDELLGWRILDPTCGGGIFLRAAFEFLSRKHEAIVETLGAGLPDKAHRAITAASPYDAFAPRKGAAGKDSPVSRWEWHILLHMLYGVDIDVKAINVASNLLTLSALTYKPDGICFPSFINTNLKRGNALITPLRASERGAFLNKSRADITRLLKLRHKMRAPSIERDAWRRLQLQATEITRALVHARILAAYGAIFSEIEPDQLIRRVLEVGVFFYEAEFPEIFFELSEKGNAVLRNNPGFDVVLGNPPWEEPAAELKQFLPEFDPSYGELSKKAADKREKALLKDAEIASRWETFRTSVEDYKKLLTAGWYQHQSVKVRGKVPGAHTNLYKYATEMAWHLLRDSGHAGLVMDGGLWSDLASTGLRKLLLDQSSDVLACGFTNRSGVFPDVDARQRFSCMVFRKRGRTDILRAVFMRDDLEALDQFDTIKVAMPVDPIREDPRESYPVPEVRSQEHHDAERAFLSLPSLRDEPWCIDTYSRELNAGEQRHFFHADKQPEYYPLVQGTQFNLFGVHQGGLPDAWVDPSDEGAGAFLRDKQKGRILKAIADHLVAHGKKLSGGKKNTALRWIAAVTGAARADDVPDEWVRLDWDGYRLAWRDVARNDDVRTLIAAIVPPGVALSDKAPFVRPFSLRVHDKGIAWPLQYAHDQLLYLAGALSSFACDSVARSRLAKTTFTSAMFQGLPVPPWTGSAEQRRVAELTAQLTCLPATPERPWADYRDLAASVGLTPERHGLVDVAARRDAEVELNAVMARLYGLDRRAFCYLMDTLFMTPKHRQRHTLLRDSITEML